MTFLNSFFYHEQGWWPTPRWALRVLSIYAIAALSGALLFLICTVLLAIFFPRQTPTAPNLALSVFGYIDLVKLGTGGALVCIVPYLIYMIIATKKARHQLIFASTVVLIAIFSGLMLTERLTAETIKFPQGMELRTNKVDARLCQYLTIIRCSFPHVNCQQFGRYPNGTWISSADATLVYPERPGSFRNVSVGPHTIVIDGPNGRIDLTEYLEKTCRYESRLIVPSPR